MSKLQKRWLLRLAAVLVAAFAFYWWTQLRQSAEHSVMIVNQSGQPITSLEITLGEQKRSFPNVPPGGEVSASFANAGEGKILVKGSFPSGTMIHGLFGLAGTEGLNLIILPGGEITVRKEKK